MYFVDIYYICNMKLNYKNDFDFILKLATCIRHEDGTCEKRDVGWPEHDWVATFWTANKANVYVASHKGDMLVNCFNDNGRIHVVFNNHRLGKGVLRVDFHSEIPNAIYPDGIQDLYEPQPLDVELVDGPGDCAGAAEVEVLLPYIKGDRGEKLTYGDLTAQDKEDLIAPIKESINKAITEKQDKLSVTADFDLTENLLSLTDIGKRRLFDDMWASINGTKLANGNYRMGANGKELTYNEALVRYERNGFIQKWNSCCVYHYEFFDDRFGQYNEATEAFDLCDVPLTYAEALEIEPWFYDHMLPSSGDSSRFCGLQTRSIPAIRTHHHEAFSYFRFFGPMPKVERIRFSSTGRPAQTHITDATYMFNGCISLHSIDGVLLVECASSKTGQMFGSCYKLKNVKLKTGCSLDLRDCKELSLESVQYMVTNSTPSDAITLTFHPDVYAKLTGDTTNEAAAALTEEELAQWVAITEAAAAKNISFATI